MASIGTLANPQVVINGQSLLIIPNSFSAETGLGENVVKAQAFGNVVVPIISSNLENAVGEAKFSLSTNATNIAIIESVRTLVGQNVLQFDILSSDGSEVVTRTLPNATVTTEINYEYKSEGVFEVEFKGAQIV